MSRMYTYVSGANISGYSILFEGLLDILRRDLTQRIEISPLLGEIAEALLGVHDENSL